MKYIIIQFLEQVNYKEFKLLGHYQKEELELY